MSMLSRAGQQIKAEFHHFIQNETGVAHAALSYAADQIRPVIAATSHDELVHLNAGRVKQDIRFQLFQNNGSLHPVIVENAARTNKKIQALAHDCLERGMVLTIKADTNPFRYSRDPVGVEEKVWPVFKGSDQTVAHDFADYAVNVLRYRTLKALAALPHKGDVVVLDHDVQVNGVKLRVPAANDVDGRLVASYVGRGAKFLREEIADTYGVGMAIEVRPITGKDAPVRHLATQEVVKPTVAIATLIPLH